MILYFTSHAGSELPRYEQNITLKEKYLFRNEIQLATQAQHKCTYVYLLYTVQIISGGWRELAQLNFLSFVNGICVNIFLIFAMSSKNHIYVIATISIYVL